MPSVLVLCWAGFRLESSRAPRAACKAGTDGEAMSPDGVSKNGQAKQSSSNGNFFSITGVTDRGDHVASRSRVQEDRYQGEAGV